MVVAIHAHANNLPITIRCDELCFSAADTLKNGSTGRYHMSVTLNCEHGSGICRGGKLLTESSKEGTLGKPERRGFN